MESIKVKIDWCDKNFAAVTDDERLNGMVIVTASSYDKLMSDLRDAISEHVANEDVSEWLKAGEYDFDEELGTAALIRRCEQFTTLAAISRASGINQTLLTHYATGLKVPREKQRERIVAGLHHIGQIFMSIK